MPKVETYSFKHSGAIVNTDVYFGKMRKHTNHSLRDLKVFYIELSEEAARYHGYNFVYADTFKKVTEKWEKSISKFMDSERSFKKVIALDVSSIMFDEMAAKLGEKHNRSDDYHNNIAIRPYNNKNAQAYPTSRLELEYHIGYILTIGEKRFWSYHNDDNMPDEYTYTPESLDGHGYPNNDWVSFKFIDWTEERELWIRNMYESFNRVIAQCRRFYRQDENVIAEIMDKGSNLLLENKKD